MAVRVQVPPSAPTQAIMRHGRRLAVHELDSDSPTWGLVRERVLSPHINDDSGDVIPATSSQRLINQISEYVLTESHS